LYACAERESEYIYIYINRSEKIYMKEQRNGYIVLIQGYSCFIIQILKLF
jgi:hypothetical protein